MDAQFVLQMSETIDLIVQPALHGFNLRYAQQIIGGGCAQRIVDFDEALV